MVDSKRKSLSLYLSKKLCAVCKKLGLVALSPAKKPTPSAIIAKIAINRPKLFLIERNTVLTNALLIASLYPSSYHSIKSTLTGLGLIILLDTDPLLSVITLSAIAVIAELCVIITTVIPLSTESD